MNSSEHNNTHNYNDDDDDISITMIIRFPRNLGAVLWMRFGFYMTNACIQI